MTNQQKLDMLIALNKPVRTCKTVLFGITGTLSQPQPGYYNVREGGNYCVFFLRDIESIYIANHPDNVSQIYIK